MKQKFHKQTSLLQYISNKRYFITLNFPSANYDNRENIEEFTFLKTQNTHL